MNGTIIFSGAVNDMALYGMLQNILRVLIGLWLPGVIKILIGGYNASRALIDILLELHLLRAFNWLLYYSTSPQRMTTKRLATLSEVSGSPYRNNRLSKSRHSDR